MIVTKSWLNEWIDLSDISTEYLAKTFNSIGLEVDRVHSYEVPKKIVFGKVLECEKHPDADKLNVCKVDIGTSIRQIVCGASNIRAGLDVVVATIGAIMPSGLAIKPVKLRGIESEGMICSASEIGLEDFQDGIIELDSSIGKFQLGQEVCENPYFQDDLIEIELTANRGDCLSINGVARDLSAAFDKPLKDISSTDNEDRKIGIGRILTLSHDGEFNVNLRYKAIDLKDLSLPLMLKLRLAQIEEKRDTDIESLLLYVTHSSGVILRAYDYDFFLDENEKMAKIELIEDENGYACVSSKEKASTIGVSQETKSKMLKNEGLFLIEASYIPPDEVSKKMSINKVESCPMYYRTSRGSEPELDKGLNYCATLLNNSSSSSIYAGSIEICDAYEDKIVSVTKQDIDEIIGAKIDKLKVSKILQNLCFDITKSSSDTFVIQVPRFRHDIVNKQDIIEEIVRLVGIDNIPSKPFTFTEANRLNDDYEVYKKRRMYRQKAAHSGFFESVHFVFDERKILQSYGFECLDERMEILNPIVNTLDTLRPTLLTSLLKSASKNIKNGYTSVKLFEVGSVFSAQREESIKMSLLFSGTKHQESLSNVGKPEKIDFAYFTQKVSDIIGDISLVEHETTHNLSHMFQSAKIVQNEVVVGELFRVHPSVEDEYGLEQTYMCELDFNLLSYTSTVVKKASKFQASFRDLSIIMPQNMSFDSVKNVINQNEIKELVRFYPVDKYSDDTLGDTMSLSIRFVLQSDDKTLEEDDITSAMDTILDSLKTELGISLR